MAGSTEEVACVCFSILTFARQSNFTPKHDSSNAYAARPGGHRKVLAVEAAVKEQARRLAAGREIGTALFWAELGQLHPAAKPMKGHLRDVMEIVSDCEGDAFRAMYTTRIGDEVYVLHAFQKKSKKGIHLSTSWM